MNRYHHYHNHGMRRAWHGGVHSGLWLIGLAVLFLTGFWWPGILVLVGISMVLQWAFSKSSPQVFEPADQPVFRPAPPAPMPAPPMAPAPAAAAPVSAAFTPAMTYHPLAALPSSCPRCGGPVRANEVKWTGAHSASCAYCGSALPLKKA